MSEAKHTPGPWATDEDDHDAPYQDIKIEAGKHHTICTVWIDDAPVRDFNAEQQANARLIAASTELLEFVKEWLGRQGTDENYMVAKARAAIAKATGTNP